MKTFTVNIIGIAVQEAKDFGYHAYYANGITAIEIKAKDKKEAIKKASKFGKVAIAFE